MLFIFYSLVEDLNYLNEVVVIGYGTQTRQELTGSVASVAPRHLKTTNHLPDLIMNHYFLIASRGRWIIKRSDQYRLGCLL